MFDQYLLGLPPAQVSSICRAALPRAPKLTTGQLAVLLRRMVIAVDPEAAARWYRKGIRERNVIAHIAHDGTVTLSATGLPVDEAEAACLRLHEIADAARRAGHPAEIPGLGLLPAPDARHRVAQQRRAQWRFAVTDPDGHLITEGQTRRRPGSAGQDGPPGGIVETHVPLTLLQELTAGAAAAGGPGQP